MRLHYPPHQCRYEQEDPPNEHRDDNAGIQPIQTFSLVEGAVLQAEPNAEVGESAPTRSRAAGRPLWNSKIDAEHHHGRDERSGPENPVPGELVDEPPPPHRHNVPHKPDI